jgi:flavorubredoxin
MIPVTLPTKPEPVADDTWLIPTLALDAGSGAYIGAHSLVIRGAEPVIVDTGCSLVRDAWAAQTFSVVEPEDVRWVFLSHDDHDHIGNLEFVLDTCPNATLIACFAITGRLAGDVELPLDRMRWLDAGGTFDAGDRTFSLVRPPMFDSPTTRALYDHSTGMLWVADSFGSLFPSAVYDANDVPDDLYDFSFTMLNTWNTPWLEWVDVERYTAHVRQSWSLAPSVVASAHGPILRGERIDDAFRRTLALKFLDRGPSCEDDGIHGEFLRSKMRVKEMDREDKPGGKQSFVAMNDGRHINHPSWQDMRK